MTRIKVCCISSPEEAQLAVAAGAHALGLVSHMPSGPGVIGEALIAEIAARVPPAIGSFLLTSAQDAATIAGQQRRCRVNTLQICDALSAREYATLRYALPGVSLVQVIHVQGAESVDEARGIAPSVDGILLDSGNPNAAVKELGGTGRVHDWATSRQIVEAVDVPVFLAGGLHAGNVGDAIRAVRPYGVDLCTGVRTDDALDAAKLGRFVAAVQAA